MKLEHIKSLIPTKGVLPNFHYYFLNCIFYRYGGEVKHEYLLSVYGVLFSSQNIIEMLKIKTNDQIIYTSYVRRKEYSQNTVQWYKK